MKSLLAIVLVCCTYVANASDDNKELKLTEHAQTWVDKYNSQWAFIAGLEKDLFQSLLVRNSKGPAWQQEAIEHLESLRDFHEAASYYYERVTAEDCEMSEEDWDQVEPEYQFKWRAVKSLKGSQKTIMYLVRSVLVLHGGDSTCEVPEDEDVFLNERNNAGNFIYLGVRSSKPMQ